MKRDILLILIGIFSGAVFSGILFLIISPPRGQPLQLQQPSTPSNIFVDISGCVNAPGVYSLPWQSRVIDAVEAAKGFTSDVDENRVNLSKRIYDEEKIFIPSIGSNSDVPFEGLTITPSINEDKIQKDGFLLDINHATLDDLERLPGIGEKKAQDIINYRENYGLFDKIEDIQMVPGIGTSIFSEIQQFITVDTY